MLSAVRPVIGFVGEIPIAAMADVCGKDPDGVDTATLGLENLTNDKRWVRIQLCMSENRT